MKRITIFLLMLGLLPPVTGQSQQLTLSLRNVPLQRVFDEIKKLTGYSFIYTREQLAKTTPVTIVIKNASIQEVLDRCLAGQGLTYSIQNRIIILKAFNPPRSNIDDTTHTRTEAHEAIRVLVIDQNSRPLAGASFILRRPDHSAIASGITDANGKFRIPIGMKDSYRLELSFIGFDSQTREIAVKDRRQSIVVQLERSAGTLDIVQTTAYSRTTMRFNTGDISTIDAGEIAHSPASNLLQSLQGRVAGLFVTETTGKPNGGFTAQVRGLNTLSGGPLPSLGFTEEAGQPIFIVDGVEFPANSTLPLAGLPNYSQAQFGGNGLNYLDPSIIESVNVLKGADATAIYGSRGAFGVVLITTKKAKPGEPSVTIGAVQGVATKGTTPRLLGLRQYLEFRHNALDNAGSPPGPLDADLNGAWDTTRSTDWTNFLLGAHAPVTKGNATWSAGGGNNNILLGAFYSSIGDIERSGGAVRQGGLSLSLSTAINNRKLTLAFSGNWFSNHDNTLPVDLAGQGETSQAPDAPYPYLPDGKLNWANAANAAAVRNAIHTTNTDNIVANATITWMPLPGLTVTASGAYNLISSKQFLAEPNSFFDPAIFTTALLFSSIDNYRIRTISTDPRVQYTRNWGKSHVEFIAGGSLRDRLTQVDYINGTGFASAALLRDPHLAGNPTTVESYAPNKYIGAFAVINYRWADKYILNLNGRRDGSSVFGSGRQFGNFGSIAAAWILSAEPWFACFNPVVDFLKLKLSYGLVGASSIPPYLAIDTYVPGFSGYGGPGLIPQNLPNPGLHWETDRNFETGISLSFFKGRVNIDALYYINKASDQLTRVPLASITGFTAVDANAPVTLRSYGAEFSVVINPIRNKDFSWTTKLNGTIPRTKLLSYPGLASLIENYNYKIGQPVTGFRLYNYAGVDPATGYYNFYNAAGQRGEYTPFLSPTQLDPRTDRTAFVDGAPKWYGGIVNTLAYKNFTLDFLVTVTNRMARSYEGSQSYPPGFLSINIPVDVAAARWMKPGDRTSIPLAVQNGRSFFDQYNFLYSAGAFVNAAYARLQNISLGYRLPAPLVHKAHLAEMSVYIAGQNLVTFTGYKDVDPETLMVNRISPLKLYTGGLNVRF